MPGPKTHHIFYKQLKQYLHKDLVSGHSNYDEYSIFGQGHDLLIYYDFYKIRSNKKLETNLYYSELLQEFYFPEFVYSYIKHAQKIGVIDNEPIRLFLYGYIGHHILDAYIHPLIIYYSGDQIRNQHNTTWWHGIMENLIDIHFMKVIEDKNPGNYPVHKDFSVSKKNLSLEIKAVLNTSLQEIYGFKNGGEVFCKAMAQVKPFMRIFKYDPTGIKRVVFDKLDSMLKGTSSFSYNRDGSEVPPLLNDRHEVWQNPMSGITYDKSFMELYGDALHVTADIVNKLDSAWQSGAANWDLIQSIIPNIASTHGLPCGQRLKINYKKQW